MPLLALAFLASCKESDWREPYTGTFEFQVTKSCFTMCEDTLPDCVDGWRKEVTELPNFTSEVVALNADQLKIQFGEGNIGQNFDNNNAMLTMTVSPVIKQNGELDFPSPEYPSGGFNSFHGSYSGVDTIRIDIEYGFFMSKHYTYQVVGTRVR